MTTDRVEITAKLQANLQGAADRLGLGLEIVFVGLKDVHPPRNVQASFNEVNQAQQEKEQAINVANGE